MSTTVDQAFIKQFEKEVHEAYQRQGSKLRSTARTVSNVTGSNVRFQKVGKGTATTKTRHGVITPMNVEHSYVEATLVDYYAGDWVDKLDELKTNIDERMVLANAGAYALGRKTDELIIDALETTTTAIGNYSTGWTLTLASQAIETLNSNDVPDDGRRFGILAPHAFQEHKNLTKVSSADYTGEMFPWLKGSQSFMWSGVMWIMHSGLPLANTDDRDCYVYHQSAIGHAIGSEIMTDITWHGDRAAHWVNNMMSQAAVLIDTAGVVEVRVDDNTDIT